jgi:uracil-DNA glycosylase
VDPMAIYGTNVLKYEGEETEEALAFLRRELHVVQPKIVVVMGQDALTCVNAVRFPLSSELEAAPGEIQRFTPTIDGLFVPDIDASLDDQQAKRAFWDAFKALGPWWSELPPY